MRAAGTLALVLAIGALLALAAAATAHAQSAMYSLSGNTRSQIGAGLPLPITFQPAPNGRVVLRPGVVVFQTAGPDPKAMTFTSNAAAPIWGPETVTAVVALQGTGPWQIKTSLFIGGPASGTAMLSAGGRTGPATLTWCPGQPLPTASFDPACTNAADATAVHGAALNASLRYRATANQFVGAYRELRGGGASVWLRAGATLIPCKAIVLGGTNPSCIGAFSQPAIATQNVIGGPFGALHATNPPPVNNVRFVGVLANGIVTAVAPTPLGTFPKNDVVSYGGPWTTGKVTVRAPFALGGAETWYLQGSDQRVNGIGSISLVAGGVSLRSISGYNANRGWMNLQVGTFSVPALSPGALALLGFALLASAAWMARRAVRASA